MVASQIISRCLGSNFSFFANNLVELKKNKEREQKEERKKERRQTRKYQKIAEQVDDEFLSQTTIQRLIRGRKIGN